MTNINGLIITENTKKYTDIMKNVSFISISDYDNYKRLCNTKTLKIFFFDELIDYDNLKLIDERSIIIFNTPDQFVKNTDMINQTIYKIVFKAQRKEKTLKEEMVNLLKVKFFSDDKDLICNILYDVNGDLVAAKGYFRGEIKKPCDLCMGHKFSCQNRCDYKKLIGFNNDNRKRFINKKDIFEIIPYEVENKYFLKNNYSFKKVVNYLNFQNDFLFNGEHPDVKEKIGIILTILQSVYLYKDREGFLMNMCIYLSSFYKDALVIFYNGVDIFSYYNLKKTTKTVAKPLSKIDLSNDFIIEIEKDEFLHPFKDYGNYLINSNIFVKGKSIYNFILVVEEINDIFIGFLEVIKKEISLIINYFQHMNDFTENEKKLYQNEKMASLGQLYLGITHEINNPNTYILGNTELISLNVENLKKFTEFLPEKKQEEFNVMMEDMDNSVLDIIKGSEKISKIVSNLKMFSRLDFAKVNKVNLKRIIENSIEVTDFNIKNYGDISFQADEEEYFVNGNSEELLQIFVNIIMNSCYSFQEKRDNMPWEKFWGNIDIKLFDKKDEIVVLIKDNGIGIDNLKLKKVFDPFFSTKGNRGTGLGLNVVYRVVQKYDGEIYVESVPKENFMIEIKFPKFN